MTKIILDDERAKTPIGELIGSATDSEIQITDASGQPLARILLTPKGPGFPTPSAVADAEAEIDELRRRRDGSRDHDVTTSELLTRAQEAELE